MEEFNLIVSGLQSLNGDAKTAFIVWVLVKYVLSYLLLSGVLVLFALTISRLVLFGINNSSFLDQAAGALHVRPSRLYSGMAGRDMVIAFLRKHRNDIPLC